MDIIFELPEGEGDENFDAHIAIESFIKDSLWGNVETFKCWRPRSINVVDSAIIKIKGNGEWDQQIDPTK